MEQDLLKKLKEANKFKPRETYFKNAYIECSNNLEFLQNIKTEFNIHPLNRPDSVDIYCKYNAIYYTPWRMFLPHEHTKLIKTCKVFKCENIVELVQNAQYPFGMNHVIFIYNIEEYFKSEQKNFTKVMNNKQVDWSASIDREQLDNWMLGGIIDGYKILFTSKARLPLTIKQYCKLAAYKPYRDILEAGNGLNRCAELPTGIWYRMVESIPRMRKSDIDKFILEFPSIKDFFEQIHNYERLFPGEGYKTIKSVGSAIAQRTYNIFMGIEN